MRQPGGRMDKTGGPAFPHPPLRFDSREEAEEWRKYLVGMSLRDWFAGMALSGMTRIDGRGFFPKDTAHDISGWCFQIADAMLKEREKPE